MNYYLKYAFHFMTILFIIDIIMSVNKIQVTPLTIINSYINTIVSYIFYVRCNFNELTDCDLIMEKGVSDYMIFKAFYSS